VEVFFDRAAAEGRAHLVRAVRGLATRVNDGVPIAEPEVELVPLGLEAGGGGQREEREQHAAQGCTAGGSRAVTFLCMQPRQARDLTSGAGLVWLGRMLTTILPAATGALAIGYSLIWLLLGGGIGGAILIFFGAKLIGR
jgi:hypothetical protein